MRYVVALLIAMLISTLWVSCESRTAQCRKFRDDAYSYYVCMGE